MKRCKHPAHRVWIRPGYAYVQRRYASCTFDGQRKCHACGAVVPYGPANDTGPHAASVATEVRAAELATGAHMDEWYGTHWLVGDWTDDEARGWSMAETNMQNHTDAWHAGYLARVIATHKDPQ